MPSLGVGVEGLDRLGEDVRSRVPQDSQPVLAVDGHRLDDVAVSDDVVEVAELPVDAGDDDAADVTSWSRSSPAVVCASADRWLPAMVTLICADTVGTPRETWSVCR